jgi:hypothetical protein
MKSLTNILERIKLTKEDISGMIRDAKKEKVPVIDVDDADGVTEIPSRDIQLLVDAIDAIKDDYSKYLSVFYYFDPNSLGTISEVLLTKLLNRGNSAVTAIHTGASGGLADLIVNGIPISLKTTATGKAIGLGSDEISNPKGDVGIISKELHALRLGSNRLSIGTLNDLKRVYKKDKNAYNTILSIENRIDAIAKKIAGPDNQEVLVWAEKKYKKGILTDISIHVRDYQLDDVKNTLSNSLIYVTEKAWGLKDSSGKILVQADNSGKSLNIMPEFIYRTTNDQVINIHLPSPEVTAEFSEKIKREIPDQLFNALDNIYTDIFGSKP